MVEVSRGNGQPSRNKVQRQPVRERESGRGRGRGVEQEREGVGNSGCHKVTSVCFC